MLTEVVPATRETWEDSPGEPFGFDVIDSRTGDVLAWRGFGSAAYSIAESLNRSYEDELAPARDTLVHEIVMARVGGDGR